MRSLQNNHISGIKLWCMHHAYAMAFLLILCCFFGYSIAKIYGFAILPDEFGYWSYAAAAAGYDWSGIVSLNSYYSYGYSVILLPVFLLFQDGLMAYRTAVAVNFVMLAGIGLMLQYLAERIFPDANRKLLSAFAAAAALVPTLLLYARTTMAETILAFLYLLAVVLLYQYLERGNMYWLFLLLVVLIYIHFVHMRAVALLVAGVLSALSDRLFFRDGRQNRHSRGYLVYVPIVAAAVVLFVMGMNVRDTVFERVYEGASEIFQVNDYRGQFGKLQYIVTPEGLGNLAVSIAGKTLYLGTATYGTAFWGLWHAWKSVRRGQERTKRVFWCFILLSAAGALMVNAVYTVHPGRVDALAYGRYHEYVFPVLILAGLYEMWHTCRLWRGMLLNAVLELCMLLPVLYSLYRYHQTSLHACMVLGMSYLYDAGNPDPVAFYISAYAFGILLMALVTVLVAVSRKNENRIPVLLVIAVMELLLAMRASAAVMETGSIGAYRDSVVADRITELTGGQTPRKVLYLDSGGENDIGRIQFLLRDTRITVLDVREKVDDYSEDEMGRWDLVLTDYKADYGKELSKRYDYILSSGHFILYYNRKCK